MIKKRWIVTVALIGFCVAAFSVRGANAKEEQEPVIQITAQEIADAPMPGDNAQEGDYFTIDSTPEDVRRVMGEPTNEFFDGREKVWYYGDDAVYFNFYGQVVGIDNKSGKLKFR